jgi:hypothetical protein
LQTFVVVLPHVSPLLQAGAGAAQHGSLAAPHGPHVSIAQTVPELEHCESFA